VGSIGKVDIGADGAIAQLIICRSTRFHRRIPISSQDREGTRPHDSSNRQFATAPIRRPGTRQRHATRSRPPSGARSASCRQASPADMPAGTVAAGAVRYSACRGVHTCNAVPDITDVAAGCSTDLVSALSGAECGAWCTASSRSGFRTSSSPTGSWPSSTERSFRRWLVVRRLPAQRSTDRGGLGSDADGASCHDPRRLGLGNGTAAALPTLGKVSSRQGESCWGDASHRYGGKGKTSGT
jgi:hypothetical protein